MNNLTRSIWIKCYLFCCLLVFGSCITTCAAEKVVLQLRWYHQFQFAGYYMAQELGYYRDAGLDVEIRPLEDGINTLSEVMSGNADFGISGTNLLVERSHGVPVVSLAAICQQDPSVFIAMKESNITTVADFIGKKVMLPPNGHSLILRALLHQEGVLDQVDAVTTQYGYMSLVNGDVDVYNAYMSNEPFVLEDHGYDISVIKPADYGINFYGDILFTNEQFLQQHPHTVEKFRAASLRGWNYALEHPDEAIALILAKYNTSKTLEQLQYEAQVLRKIILPTGDDWGESGSIGTMDLSRWAQSTNYLIAIDEIPANFTMSDNFIYTPPTPRNWHEFFVEVVVMVAAFTCLLGVLIYIIISNARLRKIRHQLADEIAERKQAEQSLRFERDKLKSIFAAMEDGVYIVDDNYNIQYVNPILVQELGAYAGRKCYAYFHDRLDVCPWCKNGAVQKGETVRWEFSFPKTHRTYDLVDTPLRTADGSIWKLEIFRDITQRKNIENALKESERNFRLLADHTHDWEYWKTPDGKYRYLSPACEQITGYTIEEFHSQPSLLFDIVVPEYRQSVCQHSIDENNYQDMPKVTLEFPIITRNGEKRWIEHNCCAIFDEDGVYIGRRGNNRDITERKATEKILRRYKHIISATGEQMSFVDRNYVYVVVNQAYLNIHQKNYDDIVGHTVADLVGIEVFYDKIKPKLDRCLAGEEIHYQLWIDFPASGRSYVDISYYPYRENDGSISGVVVSSYDLTKSKKLEEERSRLLQAIDQSSETIVITDTNAVIQYVNPAFERISGYSREEAIGENPRILKSEKSDESVYSALWDTLVSGNIWSGRFINKKKDGSLYIEQATISPVVDAAGVTVNYIAVKRDITHEEELEQQLRQKYKIEAMGVMAGGMAHNFNNNLSIILGNVELSLLKLPRDSNVVELLNNAKIAILRSRDLISQILTYSRTNSKKKKSILLTPVIEETLTLMESTTPATVNIRHNITNKSATIAVIGDTSQIQEVLINLCNNAVHAMAEKGDLIISLETADLQQLEIPAQYDCKPGCYAKLSVADNGCGMSADIISKIFDLFYTTKDVDEGTGVGLSTVQGIIKQHGGFIKVISEVGIGSTFELYFPIVERRKQDRAKVLPEAARGEGKILFVDDNEMLTEVWSKILREQGYQVSTMTSSVDALKLFSANPDFFDLVISDQTMPSLCGKDFIQQLLQIKPDLLTILCTDHSSKIDQAEAALLGIKAFCSKPLDRIALTQTVQQVLSDKPTTSA